MVDREKTRTLSADEVWTEFQKQASISVRHADLLKRASVLAQSVSGQRRADALLIPARLLAPIEWPSEWEAIRLRLATGLEQLLRETDPASASSTNPKISA